MNTIEQNEFLNLYQCGNLIFKAVFPEWNSFLCRTNTFLEPFRIKYIKYYNPLLVTIPIKIMLHKQWYDLNNL